VQHPCMPVGVSVPQSNTAAEALTGAAEDDPEKIQTGCLSCGGQGCSMCQAIAQAQIHNQVFKNDEGTFPEETVPPPASGCEPYDGVYGLTEAKKQGQGLSNKDLLGLFPDNGGELKVTHSIFLSSTIGCLSLVILVSFSSIAGMGYGTYALFMQLHSIWFLLAGSSLLMALVLHIAEWYRWSASWKAAPFLIVLYLCFGGMVCHSKRYPGAPLIVASLHAPICIGACRFATRQTLSSRAFHKATAFICFSVGIVVMIIWIVWIFLEDMHWGNATKAKLQDKLGPVHEIYGISGWAECEEIRAIEGKGNSTMKSHCSRIELTAYLIWICPAGEAVVLTVIALFCALRLMMMEKAGVDRLIKLVMFLLCFFVTVFWVSASMAGSSMGLANVLLACLGVWGFTFVVWLVLAVDIGEVLDKAQNTVIFKLAQPMLTGDVFAGLMLCFTQLMIVMFLVLEVCVRLIQRLFGRTGKHPFITDRGLHVIRLIQRRHFVSILEISFKWTLLYLVFFLCTKFTPVMLAGLSDFLQTMSFGVVVVIFYVVGLIMFLLPPVPGVPVYIAAGFIICSRGNQEPWYSFSIGLVFACVMSLVLKLNAVAMQQKLIGEQFGKYLYIQQLVGVHTSTIRALQEILRRPGLSKEKVIILCGGPDWPTSVMTGILKLSLPEMLLGTLPVVSIQVPCVLAGASLTEASLRDFSSLIVMLVGVSQGGMMLLAAMFIARENERNFAELSKPLPQHKELIAKCDEVKKAKLVYVKSTAWKRLRWFQKTPLVLSMCFMFATCWASFFMGSSCFRKFEIGNRIDDSYENGGLRGNTLNLVTFPLGVMVLGSMLLGIVIYTMYAISITYCLQIDESCLESISSELS